MALLAAATSTPDRANVTQMLISAGNLEQSFSPAARSAPSKTEDAAWPPPHWAQIDRVNRDDEDAVTDHILAQKPVVIQNGSIVKTSAWEDLGALVKKMSGTQVLVKRSRQESVAYFRADRNSGNHPFEASEYVKESKMAFSDFVAQADSAHERHCSAAKLDGTDGDVLYCQESFQNHPELEQEFATWDWTWLLKQCQRHNWGLPETNVLFMGTEGATTPAHFDEQHNFLNQVRGKKLVALFPPDDYTRMYPFPVTHPCDRCSLIDVRSPDLERFPAFGAARGLVTTLSPGDVLYIPYGWWHYCRTETHLAASITFWSQVSTGGQTQIPTSFGPNEWTRARRNLEKIIAEDVGGNNLDSEILRILGVIENGEVTDPRLVALRKMLSILQVAEEDQLPFLVDTFTGRFGFNQSLYV